MKGLDNVYLVLAFVVPGLIVTYVRSQFVTGRMRSPKDDAVAYLALSVLYYGIAFPGIEYLLANDRPGWPKAAGWVALVIVGPAIFGLILGVIAGKGWLRRLAARLGLNTVHHLPTAWDFAFAGRRETTYVLATLVDGVEVAGAFGTRSFASSDPAERDLLIEEIVDIGPDGQWTNRRERTAILIPAKQIKHVQFWQ